MYNYKDGKCDLCGRSLRDSSENNIHIEGKGPLGCGMGMNRKLCDSCRQLITDVIDKIQEAYSKGKARPGGSVSEKALREKSYHNSDGLKCNIRKMIKCEPEWVASRWEQMNKDMERMSSALKIIRTWAAYQSVDGFRPAFRPDDIIKKCDEALGYSLNEEAEAGG